MSETPNSPEQRITSDKPEKDPKRMAAGKNLAEYNKAMKRKKESGEPISPREPEGDCGEEEEGMSGTTKTLLLLGAVGLGYYLYTLTGKKEEAVKRQPVNNNNNVVNNNNVEENTVSKLRSFKN